MDLAEVLKTQANAPAMPQSAVKMVKTDDDIVSFDEPNKVNFALLILWFSAVAAVLATLLFWFLNNSIVQKISDKRTEKDQTVSMILSPTYANVEKTASSFRSGVRALKQANTERYSMTDFLPLLYSRVAKDVTISSLAVGTDGKVTLGGTTTSYKSAATQVISLENLKVNNKNVFSKVDLISVTEDVSNGVIVKFTIAAQIDKSVSLISTTMAEGGQNAENE